MPLALTARTEAGKRLVALAERLANEIGPRAAAHDRDASFPYESFAAVQESGYFIAPIPEQFGGLGVTSVHDVLIAASRLARGDASLTLGVNMHFAYVLNVVRRWQIAVASGSERRAGAYARTLEEIVRDRIVFAAAASEAGQDLTHPATRATRTEDGWLVSGRKVFCTMSPAADVLYTAVTFVDEDGCERYGYAMVPRETPGVVVHDDWDALGMRGSGSHSVTFDGVELPASALLGGFPAGEAVPYMERNLIAGLLHASAMLGIAETAHALAVAKLAERGANGHGREGVLAAESTIELAACRAVLARAANLIDRHQAASSTSVGTDEELTELFADAQAAKAFVSEAAPRIVDRALALSGGAGYLNGSPLSRAYRDVRAGAFMHPLGDNRAYEFLGRWHSAESPRSTERDEHDCALVIGAGQAGLALSRYLSRARPRARSARARTGRRTLTFAALGLALAADPELAQPAARLEAPSRPGRLPQPRGVRRAPGGLRALGFASRAGRSRCSR